jgi:hypothetical protein
MVANKPTVGTSTTAGASSGEDRIRLTPWEEATGQLVEVTETNGRLVVHLSCGTLSYPLGSRAANALQDVLTGEDGAFVGILRRPDPDQPLAVRVREE